MCLKNRRRYKAGWRAAFNREYYEGTLLQIHSLGKSIGHKARALEEVTDIFCADTQVIGVCLKSLKEDIKNIEKYLQDIEEDYYDCRKEDIDVCPERDEKRKGKCLIDGKTCEGMNCSKHHKEIRDRSL